MHSSTNEDSINKKAGEHRINMAEVALRGGSALANIQIAAFNSMWKMQACSASVLGLPDCSSWIQSAGEGAQKLRDTGTEQILNSTRQVTETFSEIQRQFGRLLEHQTTQITAQIADEMRGGIEELSERTQQGLQEVQHLVAESAKEVERMGQEALDRARNGRTGSSVASRPAKPTTDEAGQHRKTSQTPA